VTIEVPVGHGTIVAVPSIRYHWVFAQAVRRAFENSSAGSTVVAVELDPHAATEVHDWVRELADRRPFVRHLPCMLGVVRANRRIHPKFRALSLRLQEIHGKPLCDLPLRILRQELYYTAKSLVCLSATDSMIEAIRSAVEYGIEVRGVDIEDFAECEHEEIIIEDPIAALRDFEGYVRRTSAHITAHRDPLSKGLIDARRELTVALRLKELVAKYDRVLFVGSLSRWEGLERLLMEDAVPASPALPPQQHTSPYTRVVVDPAVAVYFMDALPETTAWWEDARNLDPNDLRAGFEVPAGTMAKIIRAYERAIFDSQGHGDSVARSQVDDFVQYFTNLNLLKQRGTPDLMTAIEAASAIVSEAFAKRLGRELLSIPDLRWTEPGDWRDVPYLRPLPFMPEEHPIVPSTHKVELVQRQVTLGPFFLDAIGDGQPVGSVRPPAYFADPSGHLSDPGRDDSSGDRVGINSWVWPPCENLFYGTAYRVAEFTDTHRGQAANEPFAGTLHDGISVKATLRAVARHEERFYVKMSSRGQPVSLREILREPFVYIFEKPRHNRSTGGADWIPRKLDVDSPRWNWNRGALLSLRYTSVKRDDRRLPSPRAGQ
jgi:hypothetical protein